MVLRTVFKARSVLGIMHVFDVPCIYLENNQIVSRIFNNVPI